LLMNSHPQHDGSDHFHTQCDVYNTQPKRKLIAIMHGPNQFNLSHVINLHTINISLWLATHHPKIVMQTFHSQLCE